MYGECLVLYLAAAFPALILDSSCRHLPCPLHRSMLRPVGQILEQARVQPSYGLYYTVLLAIGCDADWPVCAQTDVPESFVGPVVDLSLTFHRQRYTLNNP